jgi:hypothetical protein
LPLFTGCPERLSGKIAGGRICVLPANTYKIAVAGPGLEPGTPRFSVV